MKRTKYLFWAYGFIVLLTMLKSMNFFYLWNFYGPYLELLGFIFGCLYLRSTRFQKKSKKVYFVLFIALLTFIWTYRYSFTGIGAFSILHPCFLLFLFLPDNDKRCIYRWWLTVYAFILCLSLICFFISWIPGIPNGGLVQYEESNYIYTNYFLCLRGDFYGVRYNSLFLEPGHTAMIAFFTVFLGMYDFTNKYIRTIFICSIFTFSLAGYILFFVGYVILKFQSVRLKNIITTLIPFVLLVTTIYIAGITYNGGHNLLNELIIERLEYDDENGTISGDNRVGEKVDSYYDSIVGTDEFLLGISQKNRQWAADENLFAGAGYKMFILKNGFISIILFALLYFFMFIYSNDKKFMTLLMLVYVLAFIQRSYPYWNSWLVLFAIGSSFNVFSKPKTLETL